MEGAGKYDAETTAVRESTGADVVILVVVGGSRGSGFSVRISARDSQDMAIRGAITMRMVADELDRDVQRMMGVGLHARTRGVIQAARSTLGMIAYGLGTVSVELRKRESGAPALEHLKVAVQSMNVAHDALQRALDSLSTARTRTEKPS